MHGYLYGYDENAFNKKIIRGRRIFCNNRKKHKPGCGRTFSVLAVNMLKNFSITADSLWQYLTGLLNITNKTNAFISLKFTLSISSAYRLWKRFSISQSRIRSYLVRLCPPPECPDTPCAGIQTISHLASAFPDSSCPIAAFQQRFQVSFL
ncbi:MAG: hypothetical protein KKB22_06915 [Candidatus Omnitrophica bacterium]|nr:hypothetical protein [Candidatus Omnitrophota bacterium]